MHSNKNAPLASLGDEKNHEPGWEYKISLKAAKLAESQGEVLLVCLLICDRMIREKNIIVKLEQK